MDGNHFNKNVSILRKTGRCVIWIVLLDIFILASTFTFDINIYQTYLDISGRGDIKINYTIASDDKVSAKATTIPKNLESRTPSSISAAAIAIAAVNTTRIPIPPKSRSTPSVITAVPVTGEPAKAKKIPKIKPSVIQAVTVTAEPAKPKKIPKIKPQRAVTSSISFNETTNIVLKKMKKTTNFSEYNVLEREVCVLKLLQRFPWAPRLLSWTKDSISMSYCGNRVTKSTLPKDWQQQLEIFLKDMKSVGVRHNDIFKRKEWEVMVKDDRLYIVDFGWATVNGSFSCEAGIRNASHPDLYIIKDERIIDELAGALGVTRVRRLGAAPPQIL